MRKMSNLKDKELRERYRIRRGDGSLFEGQVFFNGVAFNEGYSTML